MNIRVLTEEEKPLVDNLYNRYRSDEYTVTARVPLLKRHARGLPPFNEPPKEPVVYKDGTVVVL